FLRVEGIEEPITICAPPDALDPTPCLAPTELVPRVPIVYVDEQGLLHFVEKVTSRDAMRLVYNTPNLPLPFEIRGSEVLTIEWPVVFERPPSLVFPRASGSVRPDLAVVLERRYPPRLFFEVAAPSGTYVGVVEANDVDAFVIASRGGDGSGGSTGANGSPGTNGTAG